MKTGYFKIWEVFIPDMYQIPIPRGYAWTHNLEVSKLFYFKKNILANMYKILKKYTRICILQKMEGIKNVRESCDL
jgi:hypothetical protein